MAQKLCKVVTIGDGAVGKTCLLMVYVNNEFPQKYVPTVFENYDTITKFQDKIVKLSLWDTAGQEEYDKLRYLSYANSNVFLICFAINSKSSYDNVKEKWLPELKKHAPDAASILIGTKIDLRNDEKAIEEASKFGGMVSAEMGHKMAKEIGAICYMETSARENIGVREIFDKCLEHYFSTQKNQKKKKCVIL